MQNKEKVSIIRLLADCREKINKLEKENTELKAENSKLKGEYSENFDEREDEEYKFRMRIGDIELELE